MQAYRTAKAFQERGHQVRVICVEYIDRGPLTGLQWEDDTFDGIPVQRLAFRLPPSNYWARCQYDNPWIGEHIHSVLQVDRPDIYHQIGGYLLTANPLREVMRIGIPVVVTLVDFWYLCPRIQMLRSDGKISTLPIDPASCVRCVREEQRRYRILGKYLSGLMIRYWNLHAEEVRNASARLTYLVNALNRVDLILSPSKFLREMHIQAGVDSKHIRYSRQGMEKLNVMESEVEEPRSTLLTVGYIGQIVSFKGVHTLYRAIQSLSGLPLELRVYGEMSQESGYADQLKQIAQSDNRIKYYGQFSGKQELAEIMADLDVLIVPSLWYENSPNVILEAFAYKTPVVASNLGGMAELVQHEVNGLLFSPGNEVELAGLLKRLVSEPDLVERLGAGIADVVTVEQEIEQLEEMYGQIL
jgi:glycosyltransferase involved in cell wall biosynthesis